MQEAHAKEIRRPRLLTSCVGTACMLEGPLGRVDRFSKSGACMQSAGQLAPSLREAELVARLAERRESFLGDGGHLLPTRFVSVEAPAHLLQRAVQLVAAIAGSSCRIDQTAEQGLG